MRYFFDLSSPNSDNRKESLEMINEIYFPILLKEYLKHNNSHGHENKKENSNSRERFENIEVRTATINALCDWIAEEIKVLKEQTKTSKFKKLYGESYFRSSSSSSS